MTRSERQALIDRADSHLSIARQCQLLKVSRVALHLISGVRPWPWTTGLRSCERRWTARASRGAAA
jgi:hypothetical protein